MLKKLQLLWIGLTLSLIFFISGFNFDVSTSDSQDYLSEIVCSGPSRVLNCSLHQQDDVRLFRGSIEEPIKVTDTANRYTSSTFANFLNLFVGSTDSLLTVILKIFAIKSLVAAYLITYSLYLVRNFNNIGHLATRLFLVVFSFPYILFGASGVYPAPIATVAVIPILITLEIFKREQNLSSQTTITLFTNFFLFLAVIMANRFETTAFIFFGICMWGVQNYLNKSKKRVAVAIIGSLICLILFLILNPTLQSLFLKSINGNFSVLSQAEAEESQLVQLIGNAGLSLLAPVTFFDNSQRNLIYSLNTSTNQPTRVLLGLVTWIPLGVLLFHAMKNLFLPLFQKNSLWRKSATERIPALLILSLFWIIPTLARTIWFFWYVVPLLTIFVFFTDHLENVEKSFKLIILVAIAANAFYFVLVVLELGNLELGGVTFNSQLQIFLGYSLGLIAYKRIKNFLILE